MKHISISELKNCDKCCFYHKLDNIQKIKLFKGNEHTAFGNAVHDTCESMLLNEQLEASEHFIKKYKEVLKKLSDDNYDFNKKLSLEMKEQGLELIPYINMPIQYFELTNQYHNSLHDLKSHPTLYTFNFHIERNYTPAALNGYKQKPPLLEEK